MDAASELLVGERGKPALDQVDPRGSGRREMHVNARMPSQPPMDPRRLVGAVVVEDQVDVERGRHSRLDRVEELTELDRAVRLHGQYPGARPRVGAMGEVQPFPYDSTQGN